FVHKKVPDQLLALFLQGYRQATNSDEKPLLLEISDELELVKDCIPPLVENSIEGVFVLNELSAVYLTKALVEANIRIPEDMAVLSLGNSLMSQISTP
ncbi:LacI family transcriptional regulator, partial [Mesorhizobium sp. M00.F.Ca.ET.186.01.1.1]